MRNARYHLSRIGGDTRLRVLEMGDDATGRADVWAHLGETFAVASVSAGQDRAATMVQSRNLVVGLQKTEADVFVLRAGANDLLGHGRLARVLGNVDPGAGVAIDAPALARVIREVISDCRAILTSARFERPDIALILRGYSLPICTSKSQWLSVPFRTLELEQSKANATVRMIIVALNSALATLAANISGCQFVSPEDAVPLSMKHAFDPLVTGHGVEHLALRDALLAPNHTAVRSSRSTPLQRFAPIYPLGLTLVSDELDKGMGF
ncbi:MAG: hypothetical protein P8H53_07155 [Paracoccaceae bacterium]|nr:hypothetical protein [Paracoccaceae bacterium]